MSEFLPMNAEAEFSFVVKRLADARAKAKLTRKQVDHRLSLEPGTTARFENHEVEPTLRMFLVFCQLYNVSPTWALTSIDPHIDTAALVNLIYATKWARDRMDEAYTLASQIPTFHAYEEQLEAAPDDPTNG